MFSGKRNLKMALPLFFLALLCLAKVEGLSAASDSVESLSESDSNDTSIENRIYGGEITKRFEYSYVARLQIFFRSARSTLCSGVVLNHRVIITVAHCLDQVGGLRANHVQVTLPTGGHYTFLRDEINIHPGFRSGAYGSDIAFLRKNTNSPRFLRVFGDLPSLPSQLPANSNVTLPEGTQGVIVGWGKYRGSNNYLHTPHRLRSARVTTLGPAICASNYSDINAGMNENELLCTFDNVAGLCAGDWGGPLFVQTDNGRILQGLNMFQRGDCDNRDQYPSAYFNLQTVSDWLRQSANL